MGFFSNLMAKAQAKARNTEKVGGMEDYMVLVRVYFQASLASIIGINNLAMLPDLRTFKATLHVPTLNNKLGLGEKNHCKKMMKDLYGTPDNFFQEIDKSIRKNCRRLQDVQPYMLRFQGFSQDLMMLTGNLMRFKLRLPSFMKGALRSMTQKTVHDIFTKNDFTEPDVLKTVASVRAYNKHLQFSEQWVSDFAFQVIMLAKKEPKPAEADEKKK